MRIISIVSLLLLTASAGRADVAPSPNPVSDAKPQDAKQLEEEFNRRIGARPGPLVGDMGVAKIDVPAGGSFADGKGARTWAQLTANPVSDKEIGLVALPNGSQVLFEFDDVGFVKDDEKNDLDADALLADIREGTAAFNEERVKAGAPALNIVGWEQKPAYNEAAHALEWCVRAEAAGEPSLNFNTRILGRRGVVSVTLMFGGDMTLAQALPDFRALLQTFSFKSGETYSEYREGDKLAEYGLAALVAGGGVAVAAKSGLLGKLGVLFAKGFKLIAVGVMGLVALVAKLFGKKSNDSQ